MEYAPTEEGQGLSQKRAQELLLEIGPNEIPEVHEPAFRRFLSKFIGPVPFLLQASAILEAFLQRWREVAIIGGLLVINGVIAFLTENRAQRAMTLLRSHLSIVARVLRDGRWTEKPAREIVPGDILRIRTGDIVPADAGVISGNVSLDRSALTGESLAVTSGTGEDVHAGTTVVRGEATVAVTKTGQRTKFGRAAQLVQMAERPGRLAALVAGIVRGLLVFDAVLVIAVLCAAAYGTLYIWEAIPFAVALLIAAVPVALPATFTVAEAIGSAELTKKGIFVTHLPSVEEAAAMDVLCCDKTGTLTENRLSLGRVRASPGFSEADVVALAGAASRQETRDPIDLAILAAPGDHLSSIDFVPFDPATKRSEATVTFRGVTWKVLKGSPVVILAMTANHEEDMRGAEELAATGARVLAVALQGSGRIVLAGLIALEDTIRSDSSSTLKALSKLGIAVKIVTGDGSATARAVAANLGYAGQVLDASKAHSISDWARFDVIAGVYPEGKHQLVRVLQSEGHVVGMTGDGVNDAPALRQAEVGVAVANAADVAKAAASIVLTQPGIGSIPRVVETGRCIYQRMLTYTVNKIVKTLYISTFLTAGLLVSGSFIVRPRHVFLLLVANDLVTMSIATDSVYPAASPANWNVRSLLRQSVPLAVVWTVVDLICVFLAQRYFSFSLMQSQTVGFLALVASGQANVYIVRMQSGSRVRRPATLMLTGTCFALTGTALLALTGTLTEPVLWQTVVAVYGAIALVSVVLLFHPGVSR